MWLRATAVAVVVTLSSTFKSVHAAPLTEEQARITAAWWVQGSVFADFAYTKDSKPSQLQGADAVWDAYLRSPNLSFGKMMNAKTKELMEHIDQALLVVRGNTGYCGPIKEPTWVIIGDKTFAELNGGYPIMIIQRTGKVLDCRS